MAIDATTVVHQYKMSWEDEVDLSAEPVVSVYNLDKRLLCTVSVARWQLLNGSTDTAPTAVVLATHAYHEDFARVLNYTTDCALSTLTHVTIDELITAYGSTVLSELVKRRIATLQEAQERKDRIAQVRQRSEQLRQTQAYNTKNAPRRGKRRY